jgi:hypothetical protein
MDAARHLVVHLQRRAASGLCDVGQLVGQRLFHAARAGAKIGSHRGTLYPLVKNEAAGIARPLVNLFVGA